MRHVKLSKETRWEFFQTALKRSTAGKQKRHFLSKNQEESCCSLHRRGFCAVDLMRFISASIASQNTSFMSMTLHFIHKEQGEQRLFLPSPALLSRYLIMIQGQKVSLAN